MTLERRIAALEEQLASLAGRVTKIEEDRGNARETLSFISGTMDRLELEACERASFVK